MTRIWLFLLDYLGFRTIPSAPEDIWAYARRKWGNK